MRATIWLISIALTLSIAVAQLNSVDDKDCLVYYDFTRANPFANLGTLALNTSTVGTVSYNSTEGLILNGNGRLYTTYTPLLNAMEANSMSVEIMVKWSAAGLGLEQYMLDKGPWVGSYLAGVQASGGSAWYGQFCGSGMSVVCTPSNANALVPGVWYHMVYVWDNTQKMRFIYVNGTLFQSDASAITGGFTSNTYGLSIGGRETNTYMVRGSLKYLKLHQRALSQTEANNRYLLTLSPVFPDATSSWSCPSLILVGTPVHCVFTARLAGLPFSLYYVPTFNDSLGTGNFSYRTSNGHAYGQATDAANLYRVRYTPASYGTMVLTELVSGATITVRVSVFPSRYRVRTLAGVAPTTGYVDGVGTNARFSNLYGSIAISPAGDLLVADTFNCLIRSYNASTGVVSSVTVAGCSRVDGALASAVRTNLPTGFYTDSVQPDTLYWFENSSIRKHNLTTSTVTTLAGTVTYGYVDAVGTNAQFRYPRSMVRLRNNVFWVAAEDDQCLRQVDMSGTVTAMVGFCNANGFANGVGTSVRFNMPRSVGLLSSGLLVVADNTNHCLRLVDPVTLTVSSWVGLCGTPSYVDGIGTSARFTSPWNLVVDTYEMIYVADQGNRLIRRVDPRTSQVTTLMGISGTQGTADGYLGTATFRTLRDMSIYPADLSVYLTDDASIRVLEPDYVLPDRSSLLTCATTLSFTTPNPTLSCVFTAQQNNQPIITTSSYVYPVLPANVTIFSSNYPITTASLQTGLTLQLTERLSSIFGVTVTFPMALPFGSLQIAFNSTYTSSVQVMPADTTSIMNCTSSTVSVSTPLSCSIWLQSYNQTAFGSASYLSVFTANLPTYWSSSSTGQFSTISPASGSVFGFQYTTPAVSGVYQLLVSYAGVTLTGFSITVVDVPDSTTDFGCVMF